MDRKAFKISFKKLGVTKFPCPSCGKGLLSIKKDTFKCKETNSSANAHRDEEWGPEYINYVYSCLLECTNSVCKDNISSTGIGSVDQDYSYNEEGQTEVEYADFFRPNFFTPHLKIFTIPINTPESVSSEINISFALFFADSSSSANHIRIALENLLTHLKVKKFKAVGGKRLHLSLHSRIELLPKSFDHVKDIFMAIKWLGNAGSHSQHAVTIDDVLDAYELMEELLVEVFTKNRKAVKTLAKKINKKKGPK